MQESIKLSGAVLRDHLLSSLRTEITTKHLQIKLLVILVGANSASLSYIKKKQEAAENIGIAFELLQLPEKSTQEELEAHIRRLNEDTSITGYIIQLPLPKHLDAHALLEKISPQKDVDGFHPLNIGHLFLGNKDALTPATPQAIIALLDFYKLDIEGKYAVIVGRSNIVGKPLALELLQKGATVTICHSQTQDLASHTKQADILISAVGKPGLIDKSMIKRGAICIDVGCTFIDGKVFGDFDREALLSESSAYAPVPGGVGPGTVSLLMKNTLKAYYIQHPNVS